LKQAKWNKKKERKSNSIGSLAVLPDFWVPRSGLRLMRQFCTSCFCAGCFVNVNVLML
jgi:hypothetical protein